MPLAVKSQVKKKFKELQKEFNAKSQSAMLDALCDYSIKRKELFSSFWKAWKAEEER